MPKLGDWLLSAGYDRDNGVILVQIIKEDEEGYQSAPGWAWWEEVEEVKVVLWGDPILEKDFDDGYGSPQCPRFIAEDEEKIYFPYQYDGSTGVVSVYKDITRYEHELSPYPGG